MLRTKMAVALLGIAMVAGYVVDADARDGEGVRVRCEKRTARSKISVDGRNMPEGAYTARVTSGGQMVVSEADQVVDAEVEFDFDSNRRAITAGATAIDKAFITDGQVLGEILDENGTVVASAMAACRVRR